MADDSYDYLVLGSTPLPGLLAGLLAVEHKRRVCLVGEPFSPFRLQRSIDISIAPVTRPETLLLLKRTAAETSKLISSWGKGLISRVDPLLVAETAESIAALGHFRHLAIALGYAVEPVADRAIAEGVMLRVRDVQLLGHGRFEPALESWLTKHEVRHLDRADTELTLRKDGTARIVHNGRSVEAAQVILAGDDAVLEHLPEEARDRSLEGVPGAAMLLDAAKPLPAPYVSFLDRGVTLVQDGKVSVSALLAGDPATARVRLGSAVSRGDALRLAGETVVNTLRTSDGAPFIGLARGHKAMVIAALGPVAAFLAPALARHIAGTAPSDEAEWFAARGPTRGNQRLLAADYLAVPA
ncbi:hypothetical protein VW23_020290 [Devosia insulae DS-56]|uniref:Uncharacterized protein n=1 Tax=Devosia insulae DS-56 TaxID=1116389 RepID=A0A1E5XQ52_9HYPH|nr:hypothetical protein [Devosia insulae]OEO30644.1 hypothetical protein VW23_020290 [Devosia insulae DS-56]